MSAVATSVAVLVEMGRAEVAATTNFAALVGGNFTAVRNLTLTMVDQVCHGLLDFPFGTCDKKHCILLSTLYWSSRTAIICILPLLTAVPHLASGTPKQWCVACNQ